MAEGNEKLATVRAEFPMLGREVHGVPLVYLDNAATTQMPERVIRAMADHLAHQNANVHRGSHAVSIEATDAMEQVRQDVARFLGAASPSEVVFTSGTTASANMAAQGLAHLVGPGDVVAVTMMEHHSNFVPWQRLCAQAGARFETVPLDERGDLDHRAYERLLSQGNVRIVAMAHTSNVTGAVNSVSDLTAMARAAGAITFVDAAQAMRQDAVDVAALGCDLLGFSAHKMCGPTGCGVLYGREEVLERLEPAWTGGGMVDEVTEAGTSFARLPQRLEAGTPNIVGIMGLGAAVETLRDIGLGWVAERERALTAQLRGMLEGVPDVRVLGAPRRQVGAVSVVVEGLSPYDLASVMDKLGVAVRAGHHCAQPLLRSLGVGSAIRFSPAFYNTEAELTASVDALERAICLVRSWAVA